MSPFTSLISNFDILSIQPKLYINSNTRYKNEIGGIMSIMALISILTIISFFLTVFFGRDKYSVIYNIDVVGGDYFDFEVNFRNFPSMLTIGDPGAIPFPNQDRILSVSAAFLLFNQTKNPITGVAGLNRTKIIVPMTSCTLDNLSANNLEFRALFSTLPFLNQSFCPPTISNYSIYGIPASAFNQSLYLVNINRCVNTTTKTDCLPSDEIESKLATIRVQNIFIDYKVDHMDYLRPVKPFLRNDGLTVSNTLFQKYTYGIRRTQYDSDIGFLFQEISSNIHYQVEDKISEVALLTKMNGASFAQIGMNLSVYKNYYFRNYYKAQNLLADVGGIIKAILMVAGMVNSFFTNKMFYFEIGNKINREGDNYKQSTPKPEKRKLQKSATNLSPENENQSINKSKIANDNSMQNIFKENSKLSPQATIKNENTTHKNINNGVKFQVMFSIFPLFCFKKNSFIYNNKISIEKYTTMVKTNLEVFKVVQTVELFNAFLKNNKDLFQIINFNNENINIPNTKRNNFVAGNNTDK
jgi:hypothetical protein